MAKQKGRQSRLDVEKVKQMQQTHGTDARIGQHFGITRQAVYHFRKKHGIPFNKDKNLARDTKIRKKYEAGVPGTRIASEFKLSISQTYRIINNALSGRK